MLGRSGLDRHRGRTSERVEAGHHHGGQHHQSAAGVGGCGKDLTQRRVADHTEKMVTMKVELCAATALTRSWSACTASRPGPR